MRQVHFVEDSDMANSILLGCTFQGVVDVCIDDYFATCFDTDQKDPLTRTYGTAAETQEQIQHLLKEWSIYIQKIFIDDLD